MTAVPYRGGAGARIALATAVAVILVGSARVGDAVTITIVNQDAAGVGLNDSTPVAPVGGNPGTTLGAQRLNAMQFAANTWGALLHSTVPIRIDASFANLACNSTSAVIGSTGPNTVHRDFAGAPVASTWYVGALANALAGTDLSPNSDDMDATFNAAIGTTCAFPSTFYYGYDGNPPSGRIDLASVAMHEFGHGLGFLTFVDSSGTKLSGLDDAFMRQLEDHRTLKLFPAMTDAERASASIATGNLHWVGPFALAMSGAYTGGVGPNGHIHMYAPTTYQSGSSVSHVDTALTPNEVMEPAYTGPNHDLALTLEFLEDIGWQAQSAAVPTPTAVRTASPTATSIRTASASATPLRTATHTPTPTRTATRTATPPPPTATRTGTATAVVTATVRATATLAPLATPSATRLPTPVPTATVNGVPSVTAATPTPLATPACGATPEGDCRTPAVAHRGLFTLLERTPASSNTFSWSWSRGAVTTKADFGDPLTTDSYALCVYDGETNLVMQATAPAGASCPTGSSASGGVTEPCWKETTHGFRYLDRAHEPRWLQKIVLASGLRPGASHIAVSGKGVAFTAPTLPVAQPLTVQLKNTRGVCWEATYDAPAARNSAGPPGRFKDTAD